MMRLVKIAIVLGLLWSGYWYAAGYGLRSSISGWFATQQARGWQADYADMSTSGFPGASCAPNMAHRRGFTQVGSRFDGHPVSRVF